MTEINLATADRHQMKFYAKEIGLNLSMAMGEDTMRERIVQYCKQKDLQAPVAEIAVAGTTKDQRASWPIVNIPKQDKKGGEEPAFVGFQGKGYLIPRAIDCRVPPGVIEILRNAKQDIVTQDPDSGELYHNEVYTYPFQVTQPASAA